VNNRIMHWRDFEKAHAQCQNAPGANGCHTVLKMGGQHSGVLPDFLQLPESQVVANYDATGRVVSYTIVDKQSGHPLLIMEPAEYQAYRNAPLATRGQYLLAPQWSLDLGSAANQAGITAAEVLSEGGVVAGGVVAKGGPIWSPTGSKSSVENALSHWNKHKGEFPELQNAKQYVEQAKEFLTNPPQGSLTKINSRGDTLRYDPNTNTFGVLSKDGAPRTMFRPKDGMDYWNRQ
jgi:hypothetical protein